MEEELKKTKSFNISQNGNKIIIKGVPGEKGDSPTKEELVKLIEPLLSELTKGKKGEDGKDYKLTEKDKKEIAKSIKVPVIEKIIEKTEVVREIPIVTNEVKEIAIPLDGEEVIKKINELEITPDKQINVDHIKGVKEFFYDNYPRIIPQKGGGLEKVEHDETLEGDGTVDSPLRALATGSGDMEKSVYDPANGERQVAFDSISITFANFNTAIANSTLIPEQWYLITDYQTYANVYGTANPTVYFTGDVERIFLKARTVNEVYVNGLSADFEETIKFRQDIPSDTSAVDASISADYVFPTYTDGVNSGNRNITIGAFDRFTIDLDSNGIAKLGADTSLLAISGNDGTISFDLSGGNYNDDWTLDVDGKTVIILDGSNQYLTNGLDLTLINTSGTIGGQISVYIPIVQPANTWSIGIYDSTKISVNDHVTDFITNRMAGTFTLGANDAFHGVSVSLSDANENDDWEFDAINNRIVLLDGTSQYITNGFDFNEVAWNGESLSTLFNYVTQTFNGRIYSRTNKKVNFEYDVDYRGRKVRMCKPLVSTWSAGTYNYGTFKTYSGYVYMALKTTSSAPNTAGHWTSIIPSDSYNIMAGQAYIIENIYSIQADTSDYQDVYLLNTANLDSATTVINSKIKQGNYDNNVIAYLTTVQAFKNMDVILDGFSYLSAMNNSTLVANGSNYVGSMQYASANIQNVIIGTFSYATLLLATNSFIRGLADCQLGRITTSVFAGTLTRVKAVAMYNAMFTTNSSDIDVGYLTSTDFYGAATYMQAVNLLNCQFDSTVTRCSLGTQSNKTYTTALTDKNFLPKNIMAGTGLDEYTDNTAALGAGLTAGDFYRTGEVVKVVY